jgi:hypothetical protein
MISSFLRRQPQNTHDQNDQTNPHQSLAPSREEKDETRIVSVPATSIVVRKEGMWSFAFFRILSIQ